MPIYVFGRCSLINIKNTHQFKVKMAARLKYCGFVSGFVCGAALSSGLALTALKLQRDAVPTLPEVQEEIGRFGFPVTGAQVRYYANHTLSYDQAKRTPRWVAEHLTHHKLRGQAERKHCQFRPDPAIPESFSAANEDYLRSGWSRGHMTPAGDNKQSEESMSETFYLSNIVPQNYENNSGFWNRLEMYCRRLTEQFQEVWVVSGPLTLPTEEEEGGRKVVRYQVIGRNNVSVPTHLFKVILVQNYNDRSNNTGHSPGSILALGAFIVPNQPIGFDRPLTDFQVSLSELEKLSGLSFFPKLQRSRGSGEVAGLELQQDEPADLCETDGCELMGVKEFTLYLTARKVANVRSQAKLDKLMSELANRGIQPDDYLTDLYLQKKKELSSQEPQQGKPGT